STSNYVARKYGVRSAMPGFIALKICPDLIIVEPNFSKYKKAAQEIREILSKYHENFESTSLDEAYLDITDKVSSVLEAENLVSKLRNEIKQKTKLTVSAGIAPNKFLAKLASDFKKPNNQFTVPFDSYDNLLLFLSNIECKKIKGIGQVTARILERLGIKTCCQIVE
ncbi:MAG: hypothetical protein MHPSP_002718, partial [Paramarteilia canceri]